MNRCTRIRARLTLGACMALAGLPIALPLPAAAQESLQRYVPQNVTPAKLTVTAAPEIVLDGKADRLSPGSRIRDTRNILVLSAGMTGQTFPVVYRRDAAGLVHEVWLLTPAEAEKIAGAAGSGYQRLNELLQTIFGSRR